MRSIKRILVILPPVPDNMALQRAQQLALKLHAELDLLVIDSDFDQREFLDQQLTHLQHLGIRAEGEQAEVDSAQASETILETARLLGSDLLIKQPVRDSSSWLNKHLTLPDDWHLARESKVPLLLVQGHQAWTAGNVLAAMDVEHHDQPHLSLQGNVMDYAAELCALFDARLNVVSAYKPVSQSQAGHVVVNPFSAEAPAQTDAFQPQHHADAQHCLEQCRWFKEEYALAKNRMHIVEGPARVQIPIVAGKLNASLVVLGTVARHGLFGALVGNTVESVLDQLHCDVLILQPHIASSGKLDQPGEQAG